MSKVTTTELEWKKGRKNKSLTVKLNTITTTTTNSNNNLQEYARKKNIIDYWRINVRAMTCFVLYMKGKNLKECNTKIPNVSNVII